MREVMKHREKEKYNIDLFIFLFIFIWSTGGHYWTAIIKLKTFQIDESRLSWPQLITADISAEYEEYIG